MILNSFPSLRYAQVDEFSIKNDAYCHCKTIPYYIFAQAFEGHYEIDANGEFAVCEEGGAFFVPPDTPLKIWHYVNKKSGIMRVRFVHFIPEDSQRLDPFFSYKLSLAISRTDCREPEKIMQRLLIDSKMDNFLAASEFLRLLSIFRSFMVQKEKCVHSEALIKLLLWIKQHAAEGIRTSDLEKRFPYSRSKLFALFHAATGMTPGDYIFKERIRYAAELMLKNPELSVKETADMCNWKTPYHFSRIFSQVMGISPGQYGRSSSFIPFAER